MFSNYITNTFRWTKISLRARAFYCDKNNLVCANYPPGSSEVFWAFYAFYYEYSWYNTSIPATAMHMMSLISSKCTSHSNRSLWTNLNGPGESTRLSMLSTSLRKSLNRRTWSHRSNSMASPNWREEAKTL